MDKETLELIIKMFWDQEPICPWNHTGCGHWACEAGQQVKEFGKLEEKDL